MFELRLKYVKKCQYNCWYSKLLPDKSTQKWIYKNSCFVLCMRWTRCSKDQEGQEVLLSCLPDPTTNSKNTIFFFRTTLFVYSPETIWLVKKYVTIQDSQFRNWLLDPMCKIHIHIYNYWNILRVTLLHSLLKYELNSVCQPQTTTQLWRGHMNKLEIRSSRTTGTLRSINRVSV